MLHNDRDDLFQFAYNQLSRKQHRGNYKEYLQLAAIIVLGGSVPKFSFKQPGARACERGVQRVHRTRARAQGARKSSGFCVKFWYRIITPKSNLPTAKISVSLLSTGNWLFFLPHSF